jgi:mannose-6-phosphate isomerase-like protein (cupin superfamily)
MNTGYKVSIEKKTLSNNNYRKVFHTTKQQQLVVMSLPVGDDIPIEKHPHTTQFIRIEQGIAQAIVDGKKYRLIDGDVIIIPQNTEHYIKNIGSNTLKLYTIYSPPEHPVNTVQKKNPKR